MTDYPDLDDLPHQFSTRAAGYEWGWDCPLCGEIWNDEQLLDGETVQCRGCEKELNVQLRLIPADEQADAGGQAMTDATVEFVGEPEEGGVWKPDDVSWWMFVRCVYHRYRPKQFILPLS